MSLKYEPGQEYEQFVHLSPKNRQRAGPISGLKATPAKGRVLKATAARTIKLNALNDWENKVALDD